jgi:type II secretory pathway component PulM
MLLGATSLMPIVRDSRATASVQVFYLDNLVPACYAVALTRVNFTPKLCEWQQRLAQQERTRVAHRLRGCSGYEVRGCRRFR